jgi:hypothetical protein
LVQDRGASGVIRLKALLGGSEALHDHLAHRLGDVPQHPPIVREITELPRPDLDGRLSESGLRIRKSQAQPARTGAGPKPASKSLDRVGNDNFRPVTPKVPYRSRGCDDESVLVVFEQLNGLELVLWRVLSEIDERR